MRIERPSTIALHPARSIELDASKDDAFARCLDGVQRVLGGSVREADRAGGTIEAGFGLIFSERLSCTLTAIDDTHTRVLIESRRGAQAETAMPSSYVDALANFLQRTQERPTA